MRMDRQLVLGTLLTACAACTQTAPPGAPVVPSAEAAPAMPRTPEPSTSVADAGLTVALARDAAARAAREQTLRVQTLLREQERRQRQASQAAQRGNGNERCLDGQRMRRVANGWVQDGIC